MTASETTVRMATCALNREPHAKHSHADRVMSSECLNPEPVGIGDVVVAVDDAEVVLTRGHRLAVQVAPGEWVSHGLSVNDCRTLAYALLLSAERRATDD